ncbi:hypothetical protein D9M71_773750 [compost metagenome]
MRRIGGTDAVIELRVFEVLVILVAALLAHRIRRVTHDDADVPQALLVGALVVLR